MEYKSYNGESGKIICKLSKVIDCGHNKGRRQFYIGFQMWKYWKKAKNPEYPDYCDFVSCWINVDQYEGNRSYPLLHALGWDGKLDIVDFISIAFTRPTLVKLNIVPGKNPQYPAIAHDGHERINEINNADRGFEPTYFLFTPKTTKEDIEKMPGWDRKYIKDSDEYKEIMKQDVTDDEINDVF